MKRSMNIQTLVYHRVCADEEWYPSPYVVTQSVFRLQMRYLSESGFYTPGLSAILEGAATDRRDGKMPFLLTLDDGYLDNYSKAFPVLQEFGFTATIFLVADFSRRYNWWDIPEGTPRAELLQCGHIGEMARAGIEFGSHTVHHPRLPELSHRDLQDELVRSRGIIEDLVCRPVVTLAFPYSATNARVKNAVREAGYSCSFAVNTGPLAIWSDPFEIRRLNVDNRTRVAGLRAKMNGAEKALLWAWWRGTSALRQLHQPSESPSS